MEGRMTAGLSWQTEPRDCSWPGLVQESSQLRHTREQVLIAANAAVLDGGNGEQTAWPSSVLPGRLAAHTCRITGSDNKRKAIQSPALCRSGLERQPGAGAVSWEPQVLQQLRQRLGSSRLQEKCEARGRAGGRPLRKMRFLFFFPSFPTMGNNCSLRRDNLEKLSRALSKPRGLNSAPVAADTDPKHPCGTFQPSSIHGKALKTARRYRGDASGGDIPASAMNPSLWLLLDLFIQWDWSTYLADYGQPTCKYLRVNPTTALVLLEKMRDTSRKNNVFAQFRKNERDKQKLIDTVAKQLRSLINSHHS
ncbi:Exocyst complex component 6 [Anas platyrhynchos]|uniref:Exocyst complex component 6 n=1 Tax=Anas platyrhynchos TaxID=8839 RepID=R0LCK6_ANAPL|nr:Exocyst complex component 6 [Anas platyrhynchos]